MIGALGLPLVNSLAGLGFFIHKTQKRGMRQFWTRLVYLAISISATGCFPAEDKWILCWPHLKVSDSSEHQREISI